MPFNDEPIDLGVDVNGNEFGRIYYPRCIVRIEAIFVQAVGAERFTGWECVPRSVAWNRNNAREADTARITLDYRDFPIDPRMLQAAHVQVYCVDVRSARSPVALTESNLRFQGYVDVPESTLSTDDAQVIFDCRDYTSLYLNRSWRRVAEEVGATDLGDGVTQTTEKKSRIKIPKNLTLAAFIEQIRTKVRPKGAAANESPPTVFDRPEVGGRYVASRVGRTDLTMRGSDTAWDVLTTVCEWFGQVPMWDLDPEKGPVLRIRTPAADGRNRVFMEFGHNISRLQFRRNLQAPEQKAIRLIIWNPRTGGVVEGLYPKAGKATGEIQKLPSKKEKGKDGGEEVEGNKEKTTLSEGAKRVSTKITSERKRVQYVLEGDFTHAEARQLAKDLYDEQAQGRIQGSLETTDMIGRFEGNLLDLANGDRLVVQIGPDIITGVHHLNNEEAAAYLSDPERRNPLRPDVAQVIVNASRAVQELDIEFFVMDAAHTWDQEDGYKVEIRFTDFLFDKVESAT